MDFNYKIPEEILSKIPDYFWPAFAGELLSVIGPYVFDESEDGLPLLYYHSGTNGWAVALKTTCYKLDMGWLWDYYYKLSWWASDKFDGEIEELVMSKYVKVEDYSANAYYQYLVNNERILKTALC